MGLSGCMSCLKYLLFAFNFLFWLAGIAILALAIFFRVDGSTQNLLQSDKEQRDLFYAVCYVLMAAGSAIMVVGFCGCCGALQESRMLLSLFAIALFLLLGTEIGAGIYTHFNKEKVITELDKGAVDLWKGSAAGVNSTALVVKEIEKDLQCCGYNGIGDYCDLTKITMETVLGTFSPLVGCRERMQDVLKKNLNIVVGVAIGIGVVQLLGLIFSILLCQAIGQEYTSGKLA